MKTTSAQQLARAIFQSSLGGFEDDVPTIPGYIIIREIGRGGGGVVYEGISIATGRSIALKLMHPQSDRPTNRVLHEVDRLSVIRSDAVPHIYEHGWTEGRMFLVMELINGVPLLEFVEGLGIRDRVEVLSRIADVVWELNEHGVIHRDLKPSNILVTEKGVPVIVDLGIAMLLGDDDGDQSGGDGAPIGTLAYMAPEQARGVRAGVSTRMDVYALGAIGYELLTGSTPNERSSTITQAIRRRQKEPPRPARALNPDLPRALAHILEHACSFEASARYGSAALMRDDLQRWLDHEPVSVGRQTACMRLTRLTIQHPIATVATLCMLIAAVLFSSVSAIIWWQNVQPYRLQSEGGRGTGSILSIITRSGRFLHTWETESKDGIVYGGQVLEADDGRFAVVGLATPDKKTGVVGLAGFRLGEYEEPAWIAEQIIPDSLLYSIRFEQPPHTFRPRFLMARDVFPDVPGVEVVSSHRHVPFSASCIQIHTADGRLLSEYWHDGWITTMYWEPVHERLYAAAKNSDGTWEHRGAAVNWAGNYPIVMFAIKPAVGDHEVLHDLVADIANGKLLFYRCLLPGQAYEHVALSHDGRNLDFNIHQAGLESERQAGCVELQLGGGTARFGHVTMVVGSDGERVRIWATDAWLSTRDDADPEVFFLGDLPKRVAPRSFNN